MRKWSWAIVCVAAMSALPAAQEAASGSGILWRDPGDTASLNLLSGAGGADHAPDPHGPFTFVKEDVEGTNPKFEVDDASGVLWRVKLGEESQSETAATRLVWAAGYFVDEDYYLPEATITGLTRLTKGENFVSAGGVVHGASFERRNKDEKKRGDWDWFSNPFLDTKEENGLRVMMALLNNWDLKQVNNSVVEVGGERRYEVSDLGATFGNTGNYFTRSKSVPAQFADSPFVERVTPDFVDFVLHSRPFLLTIVNVSHYREYTRMEQVAKHIPVADARWIGERISQLSDQQLGDAFRAAGYSPADVDTYVKAMQRRIAALKAL
jgi:hypothetical protein